MESESCDKILLLRTDGGAEFVNATMDAYCASVAIGRQLTAPDSSAFQNPHVERLLMTAFVMGLPEHKVRVIAPDVGGGFGSKIYLYAEDVALTWAAKQVNRSIKWTCERSESFLTDAHGRDHVSHAEMAMDKDGKFLALRVHTHANLGAYLSTFATAVPTILRTAPPLPMTIPFWLSRSTMISQRIRGHSHSVTTVAIEYGNSS